MIMKMTENVGFSYIFQNPSDDRLLEKIQEPKLYWKVADTETSL